MQNTMLTNAGLRARARAEIRRNPATLLLIVFLASLPTLISSTVRLLTLDLSSLMNTLLQISVRFEDQEITAHAALEQMQALILQTFTGTGAIVSGVISLLTALFTPMLSLGLLACMFRQLRGEPLSPADVFCRKGLFLKGIGQMLLMVLKAYLWMLPGAAMVIISAFIPSDFITSVLFIAGMILMLWLGFRAAISYSQAQFVLADHPQMKIRATIRRSVEIMQTRRLNFIGMYAIFMLLTLAGNYVSSIFSDMSQTIGFVVGMVIDLILTLYMDLSLTCYYLRETDGRLPQPPQKTADAAD